MFRSPAPLQRELRRRGHAPLLAALAIVVAQPLPAQRPATAEISGQLVSLQGDVPLGNVLVYLDRTTHADTTLGDGSFSIPGVPPGAYTLRWYHPELPPTDSGALPLATTGRDTAVTIRVPVPLELLFDCPAGHAAWSVVHGIVHEPRTGTPLSGAAVRLARGPETVAEQRTGADGAFLFCGLEPATYRLEARMLEFAAPEVFARVGAEAALRVDLGVRLASDRAGPGSIVGRVIDGATGEPVTGAVVVLERDARRTTDSDGAFRFPAPPGEAELTARRLGYADARGSVRVEPGQTVRVDVRLWAEPVDLDPLVVTAAAVPIRAGRLEGFRHRADRGVGQVLTAEDIRRSGAPHLLLIVASHGMELNQVGQNREALAVSNRRQGCAPVVYVDGVGVTPTPDRHSQRAATEVAEVLGMVHPLDVEGLEIYAGPAAIPAEFGGSDARCGVIAVWTR